MAASKVKKVKWAVAGDEPEDLAEFKDNEQIVKENKGLPPKGVYKFAVRRIGVKPNKNEDDRLNVMLVMAEPKKSKAASWNGYVMWDGFNVTDQGKPFIKRFLKAMGLEWKDFYENSKEESDGDKRQIVQIGKAKIGGDKPPVIDVLVKVKPADDYNDDEHLEPQRYIPKDDDSASDDAADEDAADMSGDDDSTEEEGLTIDKLQAMKPKELRTTAEEAGVKPKKVEGAGKDKAALIDLIVKKLNLPPF